MRCASNFAPGPWGMWLAHDSLDPRDGLTAIICICGTVNYTNRIYWCEHYCLSCHGKRAVGFTERTAL